MLSQSLDLQPVQTVTPTPDLSLQLAPTVAQHLLATLDTLAALKFDVDALLHQIDIEKLTIESILSTTGETKATIGPYRVAMVGGTTRKLDPARLVAQGVSLAQIERATVEKPKKAYLLVSEEK